MYVVVKDFKDLKDNGHIYREGDTYPRKGKKATKARIEELSTTKNKLKAVLIKEVKEDDQ